MTNSASPEVKKQKLKKVYSDYFSQPSVCNTYYSHMVANYINLLEFQLSEKAIGHNGAAEIVNKSVLQTLHYVCGRYKWGSDEKSPENPLIFSEIYQVTPAQYQWLAVNERGQKQAWRDVEMLFEKKSWHNLTQKSFNISVPIEQLVVRLFVLNAPAAVLNSFLARVDEPQKKLILSKKVRAVRSWIDALVALKDRQELEALRNSLEGGTEERFYAEKSLKAMTSKWTPDAISLNKFMK
jgi:VPS33B-interacting protein in polarity and apical restriction